MVIVGDLEMTQAETWSSQLPSLCASEVQHLFESEDAWFAAEDEHFSCNACAGTRVYAEANRIQRANKDALQPFKNSLSHIDVPVISSAALATEDPEPSLLLEQPHGRNEPLINMTMWKHLVVQALYQLAILFLIIYGGPKHLATYKLPNACSTYSNVDGHVSPHSNRSACA